MFSFAGFCQQDTIYLSHQKMADTVFSGVHGKAQNGFLFNRVFLHKDSALCSNTSLFENDTSFRSNADIFYRQFQELNMMAIDAGIIPTVDQLFENSNATIFGYEFEEERIVYPIGISDFNYTLVHIDSGLQSNVISQTSSGYIDLQPTNYSICEVHNTRLIAPLFDLMDSDEMGLIFKQENFYSNYKSSSDIAQIEIWNNNSWQSLAFGEVFEFIPKVDDVQQFELKVTYQDNTSFQNTIEIHTPEIGLRGALEKSTAFPGCKSEGNFSDASDNKVQWCYIPSCSKRNQTNPIPDKPFILVTGYRPPIFGQSYKKTWKIYNDWHNSYLNSVIDNDYDVFIVKFNMSANPQTLGISEAANLLIRFIENLNINKQDKYNENVIQGCSMGSDVVRLALLRMERFHWDDNSYSHHHCRLNIGYDGNYYGANVPLAYQYLIYSGYQHAIMSPFPSLVGTLGNFVKTFLHATMEQKATKELVMYHAQAPFSTIFPLPNMQYNLTPTHHWRRQGFLNALNEVDNGLYNTPMPAGTRNIAVSLGSIDYTNSFNPTFEQTSYNAGERWRDINHPLYTFHLMSAKKSFPNEYIELFRRREVGFAWNSFSFVVDHKVQVQDMQEIDNASGSFLKGFSNTIAVGDFAYFGPLALSNNNVVCTHKPTVSALAINPNYWPANGSMTLNLQNMGLMFTEFNFDPDNSDDYNNYFGYPNLGHPMDHFDITPFEAISVDFGINPHIDMLDGSDEERNAINGFLLNELEPWYLALQNDNLGAQARSNYIYKSKRIAKHGIVMGYLVTPSTDPGNYVIEPNANVIIKAGDWIELKPGAEIKAGATAHLYIEYEGCNFNKMAEMENNESENEDSGMRELNPLAQFDSHVSEPQFNVFPNPSNDQFTLVSMHSVPIAQVQVYDLNGGLMYMEAGLNQMRVDFNPMLEKGIYILKVYTQKNEWQTKIVKL